MSVSITEIAKRLNVSHSTVSRVLNGRGKQYASEQTARQIRDLAVELNYRPNRLASGLLRGKTNLIGVAMGRCNSSYAGGILEGVRAACEDIGYQVLLGRAKNDELSESKQVRLLLDYKVDGLICVADGWGHERILHWLDEVVMRDLPCAVIDSRAYADRVDCVVTDDVAGAAMATRHLIELGHRRIAHVGGGDIRTTSTDRRNGYLRALADAGIASDPALIQGCAYSKESATAAIQTILEVRPLPTAVFVASDGDAYWVWQTLNDRGIRVPDDIALVGYGNLDVGLGLGLTTVDQAPQTLGAMAVKRVLNRIDRPGAPHEVVELNTQLIVRRSSAARA
ncbi:MAG: LacI family DNA-binding transcriptional regulator [Capsulimonadaceae bacterium]|nr:LacI family DNA-binding transcriptional regulator [Capsulimonadaceae bacterium]